MKKWLDAAYPPTDAELGYFAANGWTGIAGYFKFGNDGVLNGWADSDFQRAKAAGLQTMAYCSGWADPAQCAARAASLGIRICLDDEGGMRADGTWVPGWLATSGAGIYGNGPIHYNSAPFHILAAYPGFDPGATWSTTYAPQPPTPCGWQWQGSHNVDGANVDSSWFDDAISIAAGGGGGQITGGDFKLRVVTYTGTAGWWVTDGVVKRAIADITEGNDLLAVCGQTSPQTINQITVNRMPDYVAPTPDAPVDFSSVLSAVAAVKAGVDAQKPVDLTPVLTALANLQTELDAVKVLDSTPVTVPAPVVDLSSVLSAIAAVKAEVDSVQTWINQPWYTRLFK